MINHSTKKVVIQELDPSIRCQNFDEVVGGYTFKQAQEEARRCLHCKHQPCISGCPVSVPIPEFIEYIVNGDIQNAYHVLTSENVLPAICGRVCPQERQCEGKCVRGVKCDAVGIGRLERFVADYYMEHFSVKELDIPKNGYKVAIVGSGPAGMTCASQLAKNGYEVVVLEALHEFGGVLSYGIPEFRLPKSLVKKEIENIERLGVKFYANTVVGRTITIEELQKEYDAIFIGSGAGLPKFQGIVGENLNGVYLANEFLTRVNLMKAYRFPDVPTPIAVGKIVYVVGAGNVAMDAARTAKRLGAKSVSIIYRRGKEEMPARKEEIEHAKQEGIEFMFFTSPVQIHGENGFVHSIECVQTKLSSPDQSGRKKPVEIQGTNFMLKADTVIVAIGQNPNPLISQTTPKLKTYDWGGIIVDKDTLQTSIPGVYAGGDAITGTATVILAMGAGKKAAKSIHEYLQTNKKIKEQ